LNVLREQLDPGRWEIVVESEGCPSETAGFLTVAARLRWITPAAGATVPRGESLRLRWDRAGIEGPLAIEWSTTSSGPWHPIREVPANNTTFDWQPGEDVAPGPIYLRLNASLSGATPVVRSFTITAPASFEVMIHLKIDGSPWNSKRVLIDGQEINPQKSGSYGDFDVMNFQHISGRMEIGQYDWEVEEFNGKRYAGRFDVTEQNIPPVKVPIVLNRETAQQIR
jgi:hypothetical protein